MLNVRMEGLFYYHIPYATHSPVLQKWDSHLPSAYEVLENKGKKVKVLLLSPPLKQ